MAPHFVEEMKLLAGQKDDFVCITGPKLTFIHSPDGNETDDLGPVSSKTKQKLFYQAGDKTSEEMDAQYS